MKQLITVIIVTLLIMLGLTAADDMLMERTSLAFSNPAKPGKLEARVMFGSIIVEGYNGQEVVIEARIRGKAIDETASSSRAIRYRLERAEARKAREAEKDRNEDRRKDTSGMKRIPIQSTGLTIEEKDNVMEVKVNTFSRTVDLMIKVPFDTSLELKTHNNGNIEVSNVRGEMEVNNLNGSLKLTNVGGTVLAHTLNGSITTTFNGLNHRKPMSFSTLNGDIDVTLPNDIQCDVNLDSRFGEIYSDFDIKLVRERQKKVEDNRGEGGSYRIKVDRGFTGKINGGGPEILFKTHNGDILIRSRK